MRHLLTLLKSLSCALELQYDEKKVCTLYKTNKKAHSIQVSISFIHLIIVVCVCVCLLVCLYRLFLSRMFVSEVQVLSVELSEVMQEGLTSSQIS